MEIKKRAVAVFEDDKLIRVDIFEDIPPSSALAIAKSVKSYEGKDFTEIPKHATLEVHGGSTGVKSNLG